MSIIKTREVIELKKVFTDFETYSSNFFWVIDRETDKPVPFRMKPIQRQIYSAIMEQTSRNRPALILILKSRRMGATTQIAASLMHRCLTRPYQRGIVLAHRLDSAEEIYKIYETFYHLMPQTYMGIPIKPKLTGTRGKQIEFSELYSGITFASADAREFGRGGGGSFIHISEAAFVTDLQGLMQQIMPRIPAVGDKVVILESTSNGPGNFFYELWMEAKDGNQFWKPLFFSWFQDPLYRLDDYTVPPDDYDDEERELVRRFGLDGSQLAWRRYKVAVDFAGDVQRFRREYPSTEEEAWTVIGQLAWEKETLDQIADIKPPIFTGTLTASGRVADPAGRFLIWEEPLEDPDVQYVIGVDTAEGLSDGHPAAVEVFRVGRSALHFPVQVAEWQGTMDPLTLAQMVAFAGKMYKNALVAVEINNTGIVTQNALQRIYFYPRLHRWIPMDTYKPRGEKYGWQTTWHSKQVLFGVTSWLIKNRKLLIRSKYLMDELLSFQEVAPGDYRGMKGDDRIFAMMIALVSWYQHLFRVANIADIRESLSHYYHSYKPKIQKKEVEDEAEKYFRRPFDKVLPPNSDGWW